MAVVRIKSRKSLKVHFFFFIERRQDPFVEEDDRATSDARRPALSVRDLAIKTR